MEVFRNSAETAEKKKQLSKMLDRDSAFKHVLTER